MRALTFCLFLLTSALILLVPSVAEACSCRPASQEEHFERADVVVAGVVRERSRQSMSTQYTIRVQHTLKGSWRSSFTFGSTRTMCGVFFSEGDLVIVYARRTEHGTYSTNKCTPTARISREELARLVPTGTGSTSVRKEPVSDPNSPAADCARWLEPGHRALAAERWEVAISIYKRLGADDQDRASSCPLDESLELARQFLRKEREAIAALEGGDFQTAVTLVNVSRVLPPYDYLTETVQNESIRWRVLVEGVAATDSYIKGEQCDEARAVLNALYRLSASDPRVVDVASRVWDACNR